MANLVQNIQRAISDFDSIKTAIESKGVTVGTAPTSEYADKINQISGGGSESPYKFASNGRIYCEELTFPENVNSIGDKAFDNAIPTAPYSVDVGIQKVTIHGGIKSIGNYAFRYIESLTEVEIQHGVESIGADCFKNCHISTLYLPNTLTSIKKSAFNNCMRITDVFLEQDFNASLNLPGPWNLSADAMVRMFESLKDLTGEAAKTLTLGSNCIAKLTEEQKQIATNKNWNLA